MRITFRGPLAPGYCDIINLTLNKRFGDAIFQRAIRPVNREGRETQPLFGR